MMTPPVSSSPIEETITLRRYPDVIYAQIRVRQLAAQLGFSRLEQWQIAIAISEAATNILKFAQEGVIFLRAFSGNPSGLEFEASDQGPGIADIDAAMKDGFTEGRDLSVDLRPADRRGLGSGLAAIGRMMDSFIINSRPGQGTSIVARKFLSIQDARSNKN